MAAEHLQVQSVQQAVDGGDLLGLHHGVDAVLIVKVDVVGLQAAQASVDGLAYGLGAAVGGQRPVGVRA